MTSTDDTQPGHQRDASLQRVAQILDLIARAPGRRSAPLPGDVAGDFDEWFDGGAVRYVTGTTEYAFSDGTTAKSATLPFLNYWIRFTNGQLVSIREQK